MARPTGHWWSMTTTEGTWTVLSGGRRGSLTSTDEIVSVTLEGQTTSFPRTDDLELQFPTPYSVQILERGEVRMALGFASTAEAQDFRRAMNPPEARVPGDTTMVMRPAPQRRPLTPGDRLRRLFAVGVAVQLLGGLFLAVFRDESVGVGFGLLLVWAGGIPVLATIVAWGVKTGIEASRRADTA